MSVKNQDTRAFVSFIAPSGRIVSIAGCTTLNGNRFYKISHDNNSGYIAQSLFVAHKTDARNTLSFMGVPIVSNADWNEIGRYMDKIWDFPPLLLIETPGWVSGYFARADGRVISPSRTPKAHAIFGKQDRGSSIKGPHSKWMREVGEPLAGQNLPMLAVLMALGSPLLRFSGEPQNFGFQFSGPPATGKTTCLMLARSIDGDPADPPNFNSTKAGREAMFAEHNDRPFTIDEASLVEDQERTFKDLVFGLSGGTQKITAFQPNRTPSRFIFVVTANQPFYENASAWHPDVRAAALQRLFPLKVDSVDDLGVLDSVPTDFGSSGEFTAYLSGKIANRYGSPMKRMLKAIANMISADPNAFKRGIRADMHSFTQAVGVAATQAGSSRASSAFGLLYAAGKFAVETGVLPASWDCMAACVAGYRNYQAQLPEETPLLSRLMTIAQLPNTLDLRSTDLPRLTNRQMHDHGAFLRRGKGQRLELLLTDQCRDRYLPDFRTFGPNPAFGVTIIKDSDHSTTHRQIRSNKRRDRLTCFTMVPEIVGRD